MKHLSPFVKLIEKASISIEQLMYVKDYVLYLSDLDDYLTVEIKLEDGLYSLLNGRLIRTGDLPVDHNPVLFPTGKQKQGFPLPYKTQLQMLDMYSCLATDYLRPLMTGILFQEKNGKGTLVGTDAHALKMIRTGIKVKKELEVVIRTSKAFQCIVKHKKSECHVAFIDKYIIFKWDDTILFSRLIEGKYPNYEAVIPVLDECKDFIMESADNLNHLVKESKAISKYTQKIDICSDKVKISDLNAGIKEEYPAFKVCEKPTREADGLLMPVMLNDSTSNHLTSISGLRLKSLLNKHKGNVIFGIKDASRGILVWLEDKAK